MPKKSRFFVKEMPEFSILSKKVNIKIILYKVNILFSILSI